MISTELARALRDSGLVWNPLKGDAFRIDQFELDDETYVLSDLTIEAQQFSSGTVLGFNGTTEWALDSVALDDALWLPREDQLRMLLGPAFRSLTAVDGFRVDAVIECQPQSFVGDVASDAYARALLVVLDALNA
ncbi:MAG: pilus assembly protein CpaE [Rhodoglobus sp.]